MNLRFFYAALLMACLSSQAVLGQSPESKSQAPADTPVPPQAPTPPGPTSNASPPNANDLRASICTRPSVAAVAAAFYRSAANGQPKALTVWVRYRKDGSVTDVRIERSSGDEPLDAAAIAWARGVVLCPGSSDGEGRIPFYLRVE